MYYFILTAAPILTHEFWYAKDRLLYIIYETHSVRIHL